MASYLWSTLPEGTAFDFDPVVDGRPNIDTITEFTSSVDVFEPSTSLRTSQSRTTS